MRPPSGAAKHTELIEIVDREMKSRGVNPRLTITRSADSSTHAEIEASRQLLQPLADQTLDAADHVDDLMPQLVPVRGARHVEQLLRVRTSIVLPFGRSGWAQDGESRSDRPCERVDITKLSLAAITRILALT